MGLLKVLGLAPTEHDKKLRDLVTRSYDSVRVVGRGTVTIDPKEVRQSDEFKEARARARVIVSTR